MRNKIKQMMKKEEGFTLVELLAVIVILGIIVAIAIPAIGSVIDRADTQATAAESALIEDAARLYYVEKSGDEDLEDSVDVSTLLNEGYLEARDGDEPTGTVTRSGSESTGYTYRHSGRPTEDPGN